jgi:hypothetical protein
MPYMVDYTVTTVDGAPVLDTSKIMPTFAESFQPDSSGKVWTLKPRKGVKVLDEVKKLVAAGDHVAAGVHRVEFGTPHGLTDAGGIDLLGRRVLPLLESR